MLQQLGALQAQMSQGQSGPQMTPIPAPTGQTRYTAPNVASTALTRDQRIAIQRRLNDLNYRGRDGRPLSTDGDFGSNTEYAIREFQRLNNIPVDGRAGRETQRALATSQPVKFGGGGGDSTPPPPLPPGTPAAIREEWANRWSRATPSERAAMLQQLGALQAQMSQGQGGVPTLPGSPLPGSAYTSPGVASTQLTQAQRTAIQIRLASLGYVGRDGRPLQADGSFGANTEYAVSNFQRLNNVPVDGRAGIQTQAALARPDAVQADAAARRGAGTGGGGGGGGGGAITPSTPTPGTTPGTTPGATPSGGTTQASAFPTSTAIAVGVGILLVGLAVAYTTGGVEGSAGPVASLPPRSGGKKKK